MRVSVELAGGSCAAPEVRTAVGQRADVRDEELGGLGKLGKAKVGNLEPQHAALGA